MIQIICDKCGAILPDDEDHYIRRVKGYLKDYCDTCYWELYPKQKNKNDPAYRLTNAMRILFPGNEVHE